MNFLAKVYDQGDQTGRRVGYYRVGRPTPRSLVAPRKKTRTGMSPDAGRRAKRCRLNPPTPNTLTGVAAVGREIEVCLVYDAPHNLIWLGYGETLHRKGATPAEGPGRRRAVRRKRTPGADHLIGSCIACGSHARSVPCRSGAPRSLWLVHRRDRSCGTRHRRAPPPADSVPDCCPNGACISQVRPYPEMSRLRGHAADMFVGPAPVAQLVEQRTFNPTVAGSSPAGGITSSMSM